MVSNFKNKPLMEIKKKGALRLFYISCKSTVTRYESGVAAAEKALSIYFKGYRFPSNAKDMSIIL